MLLCDVFDKEAKRCWLTRVSSLAAHFVHWVCSGFHGRTCPEFYRRAWFWDFIDFTSMTVLF